MAQTPLTVSITTGTAAVFPVGSRSRHAANPAAQRQRLVTLSILDARKKIKRNFFPESSGSGMLTEQAVAPEAMMPCPDSLSADPGLSPRRFAELLADLIEGRDLSGEAMR